MDRFPSLGRAEATRRRASLDTPRRARASHRPFPRPFTPSMGKPDAVAVQDAAPLPDDAAPEPRASSRSDLTSSLKRARATGLDPGSALSSSFDFLNEHRLGIKVVAPEDRPMTAGDVPPAGFASPAGAAGERESSRRPRRPRSRRSRRRSPGPRRGAPPPDRRRPQRRRSTPPPTISAPRPTTRAARRPRPAPAASWDSATRTRRSFRIPPSSPTNRRRPRPPEKTAAARAAHAFERQARVPPPRAPRCPCSSAPRSVQPRRSCACISTTLVCASIPPRESR